MAQSASTCFVCDTENPVNWKCLDCEFTMCNNCKTVHERIPASRKHTVLTIKDLSTSVVKKSTRKLYKQCKEHDEEITLYCSSCDVFVCSDCIAETHRKHELDKIEQVYEEKLKQVEAVLGEAKEFRRNVLSEKEAIKTVWTDFEVNSKEIKVAIKQREHFLKEYITKQAISCIDDLEKIHKETRKTYDTTTAKLVVSISETDKSISGLEKSLENLDIVDSKEKCSNIKQTFDQQFEIMMPVPRMTFSTPKEETYSFGSIQSKSFQYKTDTLGKTKMSARKPGSTPSARASGGSKTPTAEKTDNGDRCQLCRNDLRGKIVLPNCKHAFCKQCIQQQFKSNRICPTCGKKYDVMTGDHMPFKMRQTQNEHYIMLLFIEKREMTPLESYFRSKTPVSFVAYLPVTDKGKLVGQLLNVALERKIICIGKSKCDVKVSNEVLSNIIKPHDRYSRYCHNSGNVLPSSEECLDRVIENLGSQGVTEVDI